MLRKSFLQTAAIAVALTTPSVAFADKISLMVGGYEKHIYLPAKLTEALGYFKDEGLEVELLNEPSGVDAEDEMLAGAVQGVVGFYDHCIDLQGKGKTVESVVQFSQAPGEVELVAVSHPEIKSVADFKAFVLEIAERFGELGREIDVLFVAADHQADLVGEGDARRRKRHGDRGGLQKRFSEHLRLSWLFPRARFCRFRFERPGVKGASSRVLARQPFIGLSVDARDGRG